APWWLLHRQPAAPVRAARPVAPPGLVPLRHLAFGWLPAGYRSWAYSLDANRESLSAAPDPAAQVDQNLSVQVTAYHTGVAPPPDFRDPTSGWLEARAADRVNHGPTQWLGLESGRTSTDIGLRWHYDRDRWAVLQYTGPSGADNLATAVRIAAATRFDRAIRVPLPVRVPGLPAVLRLQAIDGHDPGPVDQWAMTFTYAPLGRPLDPNATFPSLLVDVQAMNETLRAAQSDPGSGANTTVDGHPARRETVSQAGDAYSDGLQLWNVDGLHVAVSITGQGTRNLLGADPVAIFRRLRFSPYKPS
ncbi:MAG TPA: hypothetical protein VJT31_29380, partial [Rugosimonospora sp.]|nr:hypothetical protein [Rugosimonospora sp.]